MSKFLHDANENSRANKQIFHVIDKKNKHLSPMPTEKSQPSGQGIMTETR